MLERRPIVGGCCVTEEIAPGCRASTTSYIASMLRPEVIRDLDLTHHGLRMVPCDPALQVPFPDGQLVPWWADRERTVEELKKISARDAATFVRVDDQLKKLARYLQPFFLEPPPRIQLNGFGSWMELLRAGKRFRGISEQEVAQLIAFLTGSLGEFLDQNYESEKSESAVPGQQRLWQAWRTLPAGHGHRAAVPPAERRRTRGPGFLWACDRRDGRDHTSIGGSLPHAQSGDSYIRTRGPHPRA